MTKRKKAFTLTEVIVVLWVISMVGALSVRTYKKARITSMTNSFITEVMIIKNALSAYWESYRSFSALAAEENALDADSIKPFLGTFSKNSSSLSSVYSCTWAAIANASTPTESSIFLQFNEEIPGVVLEMYDNALKTLGSNFDKATGVYRFHSQ